MHAWRDALVRTGLVAALCALAAGCRARVDEGPRPGGALTIAQRDSFPTFDPAFAWNPEDDAYLGLVYEGLVAFDDSGLVRGACADLPSVSADGRTYRFKLRPGLTYADGSKIVAGDFVNGITRLFRPGDRRSPGAPQFAALENAFRQGMKNPPPLGVSAPQPDLVVLKLAWPDPHLLEKLAQPRYGIPVPADGVPKTNGAYRIARAGRDTVLFLRNDNYDPGLDDPLAAVAQRGYPDTIRVLTNRIARQVLLGLESGRVDLACPPPLEFAERLGRSRHLTTIRGLSDPPLRWYLVLNCELAPVARRDARRAVAWGLNRQRLVEEFGDFIAPARSFADDEDAQGDAPGYDPVRARQYLEAAKYFTGIRVAVTVPRGSALAAGLESLTPGLARASIQVDAVPRPAGEWAEAALERRGAMAALVPWRAPARGDMDGLASMFLNRGLSGTWGGNLGWYRNPGLDTLLVRGLATADPVARSAARDQVGTLLESDLPILPLAAITETAVLRLEWAGARFQRRGGLDLRRIHRASSVPSS